MNSIIHAQRKAKGGVADTTAEEAQEEAKGEEGRRLYDSCHQ